MYSLTYGTKQNPLNLALALQFMAILNVKTVVILQLQNLQAPTDRYLLFIE